MNKKIAKIMSIVMISFVVLSSFSTVMAAPAQTPTGPSGYTGNPTTTFDKLGNDIIGMLKAIGTIISVATLIVLGIKYMMGSTEEKAEYKKTMLPYVIGAVLVFAAPYIAGFIFTWGGSLNP